MTQLLMMQSAVLSGNGMEVMAPLMNSKFSMLVLALLAFAFSIMFFGMSLAQHPSNYVCRILTCLVHVNANCLAKWTNHLCGHEDIEASARSKVNNGFALRKLL
jgi:hypothetical protein